MQKSWMKLQTLKKVPSINFKMLRDWHAFLVVFSLTCQASLEQKNKTAKIN